MLLEEFWGKRGRQMAACRRFGAIRFDVDAVGAELWKNEVENQKIFGRLSRRASPVPFQIA